MILIWAITYAVLAAGLLYFRGGIGTVAISLGVALGYLTWKNPAPATYVLLSLLPLTGFLNNIGGKAQAIPFFIGPFAGWAVGLTMRPAGSKEEPRLPTTMFYGLLALGGALIVSNIFGAHRYLQMVRSLGDTVAYPVARLQTYSYVEGWKNPLSAAHTLGWMSWGTLVISGGGLFFVLSWKYLKDILSFKKVMNTLFLSLIPTILFGLFQSGGYQNLLNSGAFFQTDRINATFQDPNALAMSLSVLLPLLFGYSISVIKEKKGSILWILALLIHATALMALLFQTGTRSAILFMGICLISGATLVTVKTGLPSLRNAFYGTIAIMTLLLGTYLLSSKTPVFQRMTTYYQEMQREGLSVSGWMHIPSSRWQIWKRAVHHALRRPWTGSGPGTYLIEARLLAAEHMDLPTPNDHAGNYYLELWAEMGIGGLVAFLFILTATLKNSIGNYMRRSDSSRLYLISSFMGMAIALFFGSHMIQFELSILFWMMVLLLWKEDPL